MMYIRTATEVDLKSILEIYNHSILNSTSVYRYEPHTYTMILDWFREKQRKEFPVLVSESGAQITGYATYGTFRDAPAYLHTAEHTVHIHPDHRKQGIAKQLMTELIEIARQKNMHTLIGGVDAANEASVLFHQKLGFKEVAHMKEVGYKFDNWLDLKFFQLVL